LRGREAGEESDAEAEKEVKGLRRVSKELWFGNRSRESIKSVISDKDTSAEIRGGKDSDRIRKQRGGGGSPDRCIQLFGRERGLGRTATIPRSLVYWARRTGIKGGIRRKNVLVLEGTKKKDIPPFYLIDKGRLFNRRS